MTAKGASQMLVEVACNEWLLLAYSCDRATSLLVAILSCLERDIAERCLLGNLMVSDLVAETTALDVLVFA